MFTGTFRFPITRNYLEYFDKDYMLWRCCSHLFLSVSIRLHETRVWHHLFAFNHTCGALVATYKADSRTNSSQNESNDL